MSDSVVQNEGALLFTADYFNQLCGRVQPVEDHFACYFTRSLRRWLRGRVQSRELIEDIQQETLLRVLVALRSSENKVRNPERLFQYVIGVCNRVCQEFVRAQHRHQFSSEDCLEVVAADPSPETILMQAESKDKIRCALTGLPEKDRKALAMLFLDEQARIEVCKKMGLSRANFRVVLHRAKSNFRSRYAGTPKSSRRAKRIAAEPRCSG